MPRGKYITPFPRALRLTLSLSAATLIFQGCGNSGAAVYRPASAGQVDEILWVMNDEFWADTTGGSINHTFMRAYGVLPQAEPQYFIRRKNFNQFNNDIIKKYRTIVLCAIRGRDAEYPFARQVIDEAGKPYDNIVYLENVWAQPQHVIVITADSEEELLHILQGRSGEMMAYIRQSEDRRLHIMLYENGNNDEATRLVSDKFGFRIDIPADYYIAVDNPDFTWLRKENVYLSSNILLFKRELMPEEIAAGVDWNQYAINVREYLGKSYITSSAENSYMEIEDRYAPVLQESSEFLGHEAVQTMGLWRMENDFMGGPFSNTAWFDEAGSTYYMIDLFVHAPKEGKKKFMRQLDYVLSTASKGT